MGGADAEGANAALDIPEVQPGELSEATMKDVTRILSSDEFEGRMPGSVGEEKTIALLTERFKAAGLQPGNKGSWVQEVPLVEITGKDFAPLTITGGKGAPIAREQHRARLAERFRMQDANHDGFLGAKELAAPPR